jgi:hypothetical protein
MDIFKKDLARVNPLLIRILPKEVLTETVFNLDISPTTSGTLAHYNAADENIPGSKGTFFVNKKVTMFNKVITVLDIHKFVCVCKGGGGIR